MLSYVWITTKTTPCKIARITSYFQHDVYTEKHCKNPIFYCKMLAGNAAVAFDFQLNYD